MSINDVDYKNTTFSDTSENLESISTFDSNSLDKLISDGENHYNNAKSNDYDNDSFSALNDLIQNNNGTIVLKHDYQMYTDEKTTFKNGININKTITIDGSGYTLNANTLGRIFYVDSIGNLTLLNINLINGNSSYMQSVSTNDNSDDLNYRLTDSNVRDCGGAIFVDGGIINIINSNFTNNSVTNCGGAIFVSSNSISHIFGSRFIGNNVEMSGGAIYVDSNTIVHIFDSQFTNNNASKSGGTIYVDYNSIMDILGSQFTNNTATDEGGAIFAYSGNISIFDSNFTFNDARNVGGSIFTCADSNLNIINSSFTENTAKREGGAIFVDGTALYIFGSKFIDNHVNDISGAINIYSSNATIILSEFTNNTSEYEAGAIEIYCSGGTYNLNIINCKFRDNSANRTGGAIYVNSKAILNINDSTFKDNSANMSGGAIYVDSKAILNINDSTFKDNSANNKGGAIYINYNTNMSAIDSIFIDNSANTGGAIYTNSTTVEMTNSKVINNTIAFADTKICASDLVVTAYTTKNLIITLTDAIGNVLVGKTVIFNLNGNNYTKITNAKGQASIPINSIYPKSYPVTITFEGDDDYNGASKNVNVKVNPAYVTVSQIIKAAVTIKKHVSKYGHVPSVVTINGVKYSKAQFTYLMSAAIKNIYLKKSLSTKIKILNVKGSNVNYKVNINTNKKQYMTVVKNIYTAGIKGTLPKYIKVCGKKIGLNDYTYALSKVLNFYNSKKRLPNTLYFTSYY